MASANDLIKYMTERLVRYMNSPPEERKQKQNSQAKEAWQFRWFGMLPVTLSVWRERLRRRKKK